jgi:AraC family transcriptional regulator of adaptative response/methylated-DNA-[protein]-cysteine methyltransferase
LDDRREALLNGLKADFPGAALAEDAARMAVYADPLLHYLRGGKANLAGLALDLEATPFQWKVWNVLLALRPGETITYAELARRVGDVKAVRAVARANATNPVAVVIPCHRVVGSDGSLTGYRWGLERKRQLLELEGARPPQEKLF